MATSNLTRLYTDLTAKTGITRKRDVRLERIAADRALELRHGLGLSQEPGEEIEHDPDQLKARVWPWQASPRVTENAAWHYYPPSWVDPIDAAIDATLPDGTKVGWWNSPIHRQQLENPAYTYWGHGIYFEDVPGEARRWYFITVFAADMEGLEVVKTDLPAGKMLAYHLTADGKVIHRASRNFQTEREVGFDDRMQVPGRGAMIHLVGRTPLSTYWLVEGDLGDSGA